MNISKKLLSLVFGASMLASINTNAAEFIRKIGPAKLAGYAVVTAPFSLYNIVTGQANNIDKATGAFAGVLFLAAGAFRLSHGYSIVDALGSNPSEFLVSTVVCALGAIGYQFWIKPGYDANNKNIR